MIELLEKHLLALDDYDPDEGAAYVNEVMSEDDANDPLLESYQQSRLSLRERTFFRGAKDDFV